MTKVITDAEAAKLIRDGMSVMIGGFLKCGSPTMVIEKLLENGTKNLTLIANDTSFIDSDKGKLVANKRVKKAIVTHIGMNPETGRQMHDNEMIVELVPQGTLAERIRAGGAGRRSLPAQVFHHLLHIQVRIVHILAFLGDDLQRHSLIRHAGEAEQIGRGIGNNLVIHRICSL